MAKIVKRVERPHPCHTELDQLDTTGLTVGTIAECSCQRQFTLRENQRDGFYWSPAEQERQ